MTLQISLSPGDLRHVRVLLPHQLRVWAEQVDEVLLTLDTLPPRGATRFGKDWHDQGPALVRLLNDYSRGRPHVQVAEVDYGAEAAGRLGERFFGGQTVPKKDSRGGPFYSYFYGLAEAEHDHVLHIDSDILFGGGSKHWLAEAQELLTRSDQVFAVNPLGGPPLADMSRWPDPPFEAMQGAFCCTSISTRVFLVDRETLETHAFPLALRAPSRLRSRVKAVVNRNPSVAMPEDLLTDAMHAARMMRIDLLGSEPGMWSIHPLFRTEAFHEGLPELIRRIESGDVPDEQRGAFELSDALVAASRPGRA